MDRRTFLATAAGGVCAATAGCAGQLLGGDENGPTLELGLNHEGATLREQYVVDLSETTREYDEAAFEAAIAGERYTTQHRRPFYAVGDPKYARRDGTYYRLGSVVVDEATATRPVLRLSIVGDGETPTGVVDAERLPEGDRRAVHVAHMAARQRGNQGGAPWGLIERGGYVYRQESAIEESRLLAADGPDRVRYRDTVHAVEVSRERVHEAVYRGTVDPVADTPEGMEAVLRAKVVDARISRDDLAGEAREIVRKARHGGYEEPHPFSSAYRTVLRKLDERAYLDGNVENDAYGDDLGSGTVRYGGEYYDYLLFLRDGE